MITQGMMDEYESATLAVDALRVALDNATPFDRPSIVRALNEACGALIDCARAITSQIDRIEVDPQ
jgi:hypothetical protein